MSILTKCGSRIYLLLLIYFLCDYVVVVCCGKDLKEGKKIRISEPDVLKKAGQLFTLRSLWDADALYVEWMSVFECLTSEITGQKSSDVKSSRPKWPRGQNFGLGLEAFLWPRPRPQTFGLSLASISLSYYVIGHFSGKNRVKVRNFVNFSGNNLKSYVVNRYLVLFYNHFCLGLGLNL